MRSRHQTTIGKVMAWIALAAFLLALVIQTVHWEAGLAAWLCVFALCLLPARGHLRLAFGRVEPGPRKPFADRRLEFERGVLNKAGSHPNS